MTDDLPVLVTFEFKVLTSIMLTLYTLYREAEHYELIVYEF